MCNIASENIFVSIRKSSTTWAPITTETRFCQQILVIPHKKNMRQNPRYSVCILEKYLNFP
jgi:hypothetical protein